MEFQIKGEFSMKRMLLMAFMAAFVMVFVVGCDEDDATTNTETTKITGDLNDPAFLSMQGGLDEVESFDGEMFDMLFGLIDTILVMAPNGGKIVRQSSHSLGANADSVSVAYHQSSGYWYAYASIDEIVWTSDTTSDTASIIIEDSVQFLQGSMAVQWPDSALLTAIKTGASVDVTFTGGSVTASQNFTIAGAIIAEGDVTVNGTNAVDVSATLLEGCTFALSMTGSATNIVLNIAAIQNDVCPTSGMLVSTGSISLECVGDTTVSFSDSWTITETFAGETITVVAENSTTRWTFTDSCSAPTMAKLSWLSRR